MNSFRTILGVTSGLLLAACGGSTVELGAGNGGNGANGNGASSAGIGSTDTAYGDGIAVLYANDPLCHDYDFVRADCGGVFQDGQVKNEGSHIDFSNYATNDFTVGVEGDQIGVIVDLGADSQVASAVGQTETIGGGQGFAGLAFENGAFNLEAANAIFGLTAANATQLDHVAVVNDHVYVLRIIDPSQTGTQLIVKLLVTAFEPADHVSFHWTRLVANGNLD
jgi:hypothetical protein